MQKILPLLLLLLFTHASAQFTNVRIDDPGKLIDDSPNEVTICINPVNTNNIVAGTNTDSYYFSKDGGKTWTQNPLTSSVDSNAGDPCVAVDTGGIFYYSHCVTYLYKVLIQASIDSGATWSDGTSATPDLSSLEDKPWCTVDPQSNYIYSCWVDFDLTNEYSRILFSKSTDGGNTWSPPVQISRTVEDTFNDYDHEIEVPMPAAGPDGKVYVVWVQNDSIWLNSSDDYGDSWGSEGVFVRAQLGGWMYFISGIERCNGLPVIKCDMSKGPNRGTLYMNWSDQRNGVDNTDIWFSRSTDGGNTWSAIERVNDDIGARQQYMSFMDIDQSNGNLYIVYYDRRNHTGDSTDVYLAYSDNGGNTFNNVKISESPFLPDGSVFMGDYIGISACHGKVAAAWTRVDDFETSIWAAVITNLSSNIFEVKQDKDFLLQNMPNPVIDVTQVKMYMEENGHYSLAIYDVQGRKVADLFTNAEFENGTHSIMLNPATYNMAAGSYYFKLTRAGLGIATRKLVVIGQ